MTVPVRTSTVQTKTVTKQEGASTPVTARKTEIAMTNYKVTFTGGTNGLYTRRIKTHAVAAEEAVEFKVAKYENGKLVTPRVEAKLAVPYKPAEWEYVPFTATFDLENSDDLESGAELFRTWVAETDSTDQLSDMLNIMVEKESKSYTVSYTKRFDAEITADLAAANVLDSAYEVEQWLDSNGDGELDYPDDTGEISNIEVEENSDEFVDVEWNG